MVREEDPREFAKERGKDMIHHSETYEAGLVLGADAEVTVSQLIAPALTALEVFGVDALGTESSLDGATLTGDTVTVAISVDESLAGDANGLHVGFAITQHDDLPSGHPQACVALLAEMLNAGIEATGASFVDWQGTLIPARAYQDAVPPIRYTTDPAARAIAAPVASEDDDAWDEAEALDATPAPAPRHLPRRVRPATDHRRFGTRINMHHYKTRAATARRMRRWDSFDDYVEAEVARMTKDRPAGEPLSDVFRTEVPLSPEFAAMQKPRMERRVASFVLTAALTLVGLGLHQAVAATLQALPF